MTDTTMDPASRHPSTVHMLRTFKYGHLPEHLQQISRPFHDLAHDLVFHLSDGPELAAGLRKLREAKDCFVLNAVMDAEAAENPPVDYRDR